MSSDPIIINRNIVKQTAFTSFRVEKTLPCTTWPFNVWKKL